VQGWLGRALNGARGPHGSFEQLHHIPQLEADLRKLQAAFDRWAWKTPPMSEVAMGRRRADALPLIVGALGGQTPCRCKAAVATRADIEDAELIDDAPAGALIGLKNSRANPKNSALASMAILTKAGSIEVSAFCV